MAAGARWGRPGVWSPLYAVGAPGAAVAMRSSDRVGDRLAIPDRSGVAVWQVVTDCRRGRMNLVERVVLSRDGRRVPPSSAPIPMVDPASVTASCGRSLSGRMAGGPLAAVRDIGSVVVADRRLPPPTAADRERMSRERLAALAAARR